MNATTETMVGRLSGPVFQVLPPEIARQIINLEAEESLQPRIEELAAVERGRIDA